MHVKKEKADPAAHAIDIQSADQVVRHVAVLIEGGKLRPGDRLVPERELAQELGVSRPTVLLWRQRVREQGIGELWEIAPGRGRKPHYDQAKRDRIINATLQSKPNECMLCSTTTSGTRGYAVPGC